MISPTGVDIDVSRFLDSLSAKVHPTPLSIDALASMFQEFYTKAESHITTHIAAISSRLSRERSSSVSKKSNSRKASPAGRSISASSVDQQMLSASEILDRRKARYQLLLKKLALEELVERAVCEKVYDRIWRHRSTDDEERDQKLRSRIAALSLVGIGLKELMSGADEIPDDVRRMAVEEQDKIREMLSGVRDSISTMTAEHYPLAKLQHLTAAHKALVETLSELFPASSSADEILPTLIYALITSPPETINVISDLTFTQRFRASAKVDGEAAYCLVNLEAAVSFLETVDLSSLRSDEDPSGPRPKPSNLTTNADRPSTPRLEKMPPLELGIAPATDPSVSPCVKPLPSPVRSERRLSHLMRTGATRLETASDSLRDAVLDSADQALDTINSTLNNSFRVLFGRLQEHQQSAGTTDVSSPVLPKTLEDARKLVSTPSPLVGTTVGDDDESIASADVAANANGSSGVDDPLRAANGREPQKMLELIGGRRPARDRSVDSHGSAGSSLGSGSGSAKRVSFIAGGKNNALGITAGAEPPVVPSPSPTPSAQSGSQAGGVGDGLRTFGSAINPLNQLSRMGGLFGRAGTPTVPPSSSSSNEKVNEKEKDAVVPVPASEVARSAADARTLAAVEELKRMKAPTDRFVKLKDAKELRLGEVEELLKEYQGLWKAVGKVVGS